jgi:hypothetical protein
VARLNIDDQFWIDCLSVVAAIGDQDKAIGQALRFFRMAQDKHKSGKLITEDEFARAGFSEALIGVFADRVDGGIQAVGAQKHFGWLARRVEAGRKGGQAKPSKRKQTQAKQSKPEQPEASPSYSYSPSCSFSPSPKEGALPILQSAPVLNPVKVYCDEWKAKNGKSPDIRGKDAGQLNQLAKDLGAERACALIRIYFSMPDPFFIKRGYDCSTFLANLSAIQQFEANGKIVTREVIKQVEKQVDKIQGSTGRKSLAQVEAEHAAMLAEARVTRIGGNT